MFKEMLAKIIVSCVIATMAICQSAYAQPEDLVLWNKLGSQAEIENSEVGLNGTFNEGGFVEGMFGNAFIADYTQPNGYIGSIRTKTNV